MRHGRLRKHLTKEKLSSIQEEDLTIHATTVQPGDPGVDGPRGLVIEGAALERFAWGFGARRNSVCCGKHMQLSHCVQLLCLPQITILADDLFATNNATRDRLVVGVSQSNAHGQFKCSNNRYLQAIISRNDLFLSSH